MSEEVNVPQCVTKRINELTKCIKKIILDQYHSDEEC